MGSIRKEDLVDLDFIDATELKSVAGSSDTYRTGVSCTSTTAATKVVVVSGGLTTLPDTPVEAGDKIVLTGNAAAGTYTIASVTSDTALVVSETIVNSTGGTAAFRYPEGATKVGVDTTGFVRSTNTTVRGVLGDLDTALRDINTNVVTATTTDVTTTSSTYIVVPSMTVTPPAGTYLVLFSADVGQTINGGEVFLAIFVAGSQLANSERRFRQVDTGLLAVAPAYRVGITLARRATVNGSQTIDIRWRVGASSGTASCGGARSLDLIRVDS